MNIHCQHSRRGVDTPFLCPRAGHREMMRDTTLALGDGVLLGKDPWEVGDYVNGALHEGCAASNDTINTLRNLTALARAQG